MQIPVLLISKWYKVKIWKNVLATILLAVVGTIGTKIWYFIENRSFGGISFYGSVFTVPVFAILIASLMRIPRGVLTDICAPAECIMLAFMKVQCLTTGCCRGRVLCTTSNNVEIVFPSQIMELLNGLIIMVVLLWIGYKKSKRGMLYPLFMITYGCTRFALNLFRSEQYDFFLGMPPGNVWSILSVLLGVVWLLSIRHFKSQEQCNENQT